MKIYSVIINKISISAILTAGVFSVFIFSGCSKEMKINYSQVGSTINPMLTRAEDTPDLEISNFKNRCSQNGKQVWKLTAVRAKIYSKLDKINLLSPTLFYYKRNGEDAAYVVSERGAVATASQDVSLFGNVVVKSRNGSILKTDELHWCNSLKKIFTDKYVYIKKRNGDVITGYGLLADVDLNVITMKNADMKGRFNDFDY